MATQFRRQGAAQALAELGPLPALSWPHDPTTLGLEGSRWRTELPDAFCEELGRRLLIAQLEWSEWILRRVEKVSFPDDRSVRRAIAIDLLVPSDAPVFTDVDDRPHWLVPLSIMRRRTLVKLELRDEGDVALTTPGLRLTQQLDQSLLLAAANRAVSQGIGSPTEEVRLFIRQFIAGDRDQVADCVERLTGDSTLLTPTLRLLADDPLFMFLFHRLRHGYTLYGFLPKSQHRHRLLRMSFDEAMEWRYQTPTFIRPEGPVPDPVVTYKTGTPSRWFDLRRTLSSLGLRHTRIRLQIPGAENCASYHFEIDAPVGARIERAVLLAGRPNDSERHLSLDRVVGHSPTVGLHAVEIPNGSNCRAQVDIGIPTRGWLTSLLLSCIVISGVLVWVGRPWLYGSPWDTDQVTNLVLLLVTLSAGVLALITQERFGAVASRLVGRMRILGVVAITLPVSLAGLLVYTLNGKSGQLVRSSDWYAMVVILAVAAFVTSLVLAAFVRSFVAQRRIGEASPWNMTSDDDRNRGARSRRPIGNFWTAVERFEFDSPAVGIHSAEHWHEFYNWTDDKQFEAVKMLRSESRVVSTGIGPVHCTILGTHCAASAHCPRRGVGPTGAGDAADT